MRARPHKGWQRDGHDDSATGFVVAARWCSGGRACDRYHTCTHRHPQPASRRPVRRAQGRALRRQPVSGTGQSQWRLGGAVPSGRRTGAGGTARNRSAGQQKGAGPIGLRLARPVRTAGHRGDGLQRQNHRDPDAGVDPARLQARRDAGHAGQFQQRHWSTPELAPFAPRTPDRGVRTGHEPCGRNCLSRGADPAFGRAGQQRATRTPGVHGHAGCGGAGERLGHRVIAR